MEKWGDTPAEHSRLKLDFSDVHTVQDLNTYNLRGAWIRINNPSLTQLAQTDRVHQICVESVDCGDDYTGNTPGNHFDGTTPSCGNIKSSINGCFGGTWTGQTVFWVKRHPQPSRNVDLTEVYSRVKEPTLNADIIETVLILVQEVGFRDQTPIVEPRMGFWDQLYLSWEDTERYQTNAEGYVSGSWTSKSITATRLGALEDFSWNYRVLYSNNLNLDHTSPRCGQSVTENCWQNEAYWGASQVTVDNRRYHANVGPYTTQEDGTKQKGHLYMNLLSDLYQPETEIAVRMWMRQQRHGNEYTDISNPTRFFLPANLQNVAQTQSTAYNTNPDNAIKITWKDNYSGDVDRYEYRIGHEESGRQTSFSDWIRACDDDVKTETINNEEHQTLEIISTRGIGQFCGPDITTPLDLTKSYRLQLRAIDDSRTENPIVRNYVHTDLLQLTTPLSTQAPATTQPAVTQPTNPSVPSGVIPSGGGGNIPSAPSGPAPPSEGGSTDDQPNPTGTGFTDTAESVHESNIIQLADMGVTRGCNPPENTRFCPDRAVTRGEMATFLVRAFELATTNEDPFTDTSGNVHQTNINRMAAAGISRGCNPPINDRFCPDRAVTRAEMATFMTRVLELSNEGSGFTDTEGNVHVANIRRFAEAGITRGCNPPSNTRYCPDRAVTRAEMATFLVRSVTLNTG